MKQYYVYELINHYGTIEYVGETTRPKERMNQHTKRKPDGNHGKFYGRQDLVMNIVAVFDNRKGARELEGRLKLDYGMEHTERTSVSKAGKIGGKIGGRKNVESGHLAKIHIKNKIAILQYTLSGDFIKEWDSGSDASKELKINKGDLSQCCKGKLKTTGGYVWKYKQQ
jgi:predicted GIY-YIG superfamily endonuclease